MGRLVYHVNPFYVKFLKFNITGNIKGNNKKFESARLVKKVNIGNYVHIGAYSFLGAHMGLTLKSFSGLGQGVKIFTVNDDYSGESLTNPMTSAKFKKEKNGSVVIGKHVNIG